MNTNQAKRTHRQIARQSQVRFREWAILLLSFCMIGIIGAIAAANFSSRLLSNVISQSAIGGGNSRTAAILMETESGHCRQFTFDNDSGQILPSGELCEPEVSTDAHGDPMPIGTMKRLDAISKSFSGR